MINCHINELIPHRDGMQLIDGIKEIGGKTTAYVDITEQSLFAEDSGIPSWVGLEFMAQGVSAINSYQQIKQGFEGAQQGMLLAAKRFYCEQEYFDFGIRLFINAEPLNDSGPMRMYQCTIEAEDKIIAKATLTVMIKQ